MLTIEDIANDILNHLGIVIPSESGHGKTWLAFNFVKHFRKHGIQVNIFTPSTVWLKHFGNIEYITVGSRFYNPIRRRKDDLTLYRGYSRDTVQINLDKKWVFVDNGFLRSRLETNKTTLYNIKYLNGRRIKYFIATALRLMFEQRRDQKNPKSIVNILEESQNPFGSYSMNDDISQVLKTVFTQSRTDANIHYILLTQRLNDTSAQIVERLRPLIGFTVGENALRKIRNQLPKPLKNVPQTLKPRIFLYPSAYNGKDIESAILKSPKHVAIGKPKRLSPSMYSKPSPKPSPRMHFAKPKPRKRSFWQNLLTFLKWELFPFNLRKQPKTTRQNQNEEDISEEHTLLADNEEEETESLFWD